MIKVSKVAKDTRFQSGSLEQVALLKYQVNHVDFESFEGQFGARAVRRIGKGLLSGIRGSFTSP